MSDRDDDTSLERRVAELERRLADPPREGRSFLDVVQVFMPVIAGVLLAVVGYHLTGSVTNALGRQRLELSQVAEMRGLILDMTEPGASRERLEASALALSAFGEHAVPPLLGLMRNGGDNTYLAARLGLRAAGLVAPEAVCGRLRGVLDNRTRLYDLDTHLAAVELVGELGCRDALPDLRDYRQAVRTSLAAPDLQPYAGWLARRPPPGRAGVALVDTALASTIALLSAGEGGR